MTKEKTKLRNRENIGRKWKKVRSRSRRNLRKREKKKKKNERECK